MMMAGGTTTTGSIGIHYRTGDQAAFGLTNADNRVATSALAGWNKMQKCALELAQQLFPGTNDENNNNTTTVTFYLATDNPHVKEHIRRLQAAPGRNSHASRIDTPLLLPNLYVTDVQPGSYLRGNQGDRDAWMELFLLASRNGLVANALPSNYSRTANPRSQFAVLAAKIGFLEAHQFKDCSLDEE